MQFITLLRHGRTFADDENRYEGRYDCELADVGIHQAEQLVAKWKSQQSRKYEVIVTSPMKRARATAEILSGLYPVRIIENEHILELDAGELCGMDREEGLKKYPVPSFVNPYDRIVRGTGESEAQLHARALLGIESILNMKKGSCLVVSHGMIINAMIRCMFGIPVPVNQSAVFFKFADTGYMDLSYDETKHRWTIIGFINY